MIAATARRVRHRIRIVTHALVGLMAANCGQSPETPASGTAGGVASRGAVGSADHEGGPRGVAAVANAINAAGVVAGDLTTADGTTLAALWRPAGAAGANGMPGCYQLQTLPLPAGATDASAAALDDAGTVVGEARRREGTAGPDAAIAAAPNPRAPGPPALPHAVRWTLDTRGDGLARVAPLTGLGDVRWSRATAVNARGQTAGTLVVADGRRVGFVLTPGQPAVLVPAPGGRGGMTVRALNDSGVVAGALGLGADPDDDGPGTRLVVWRSDRGLRTAYDPGAGQFADASSMNAAGDLAGVLVHHLDEDEASKEPRATPLLIRGDGRGAPRAAGSPGALLFGDGDPDWGGTPYSYLAVNGRGDLVGITRAGTDPATGSAYLLPAADPRRARRLAAPAGLGTATPAAINRAGLIIGSTMTDPARAVLWDAAGHVRLLPLVPGVCDVRADSAAGQRPPAPGR